MWKNRDLEWSATRGRLTQVLEQVIAENPQAVADYKGGKKKDDRISCRPDDEGYEGESGSIRRKPEIGRNAEIIPK